MTSRTRVGSETEREELYRDMERLHTSPLWRYSAEVTRAEPRPRTAAHLWRWSELRPSVLRMGDLVSVEEAERRVMVLSNPGLDGLGATGSLYAGIQLVLPGEVARAHRHTMAAIRFIMEGTGAFTAVEGEKTILHPGEFVTTPNWTWHNHGNESPEPVIWLDGLDIPLVRSTLDAGFQEYYPEREQPLSKPDDLSQRQYGAGGLRPTWEVHLGAHSPLLNYSWEQSYTTLTRLARETDGSPGDAIRLEYVNPSSGGPALPTMAAYIQLLRPGERTSAHRHTGGTVYQAVKGAGWSVINGMRFDWAPQDVFVVPSWAYHEHANASDRDDAVLFSYNDSPVLRAVGLLREEAYPEAGGHQPVEGRFGPG